MEKKLNQFERNDGYNPKSLVGSSVQEKWIHKQVVKKTGDSEDDFLIEEKPVKIDEVDIHKSINEEAKTTDLKYLLKQLFMTGDESVLVKRDGFFGDVSMFDEGHDLKNRSKIDLESIRSGLPQEFKELSNEELARLSNEDLIDYFNKVREKQKEVSPPVEEKEE